MESGPLPTTHRQQALLYDKHDMSTPMEMDQYGSSSSKQPLPWLVSHHLVLELIHKGINRVDGVFHSSNVTWV